MSRSHRLPSLAPRPGTFIPVYHKSVVLIRAGQYGSHLVVRMEGRGPDLRGSSTHLLKKVQTVSQLLHTLLEFEVLCWAGQLWCPCGACAHPQNCCFCLTPSSVCRIQILSPWDGAQEMCAVNDRTNLRVPPPSHPRGCLC